MKCLTSESNSSACPLILPQEIVDLIIDAVAYSFFLDEDITRALLLCSLVCKPFHHAARRHLFSNIRFVMDDYANERATNLRRVLTHKSNEDLLLRVRSVALVPERYDGPLNQRILRSRKEGQGGLSNLHKTLDPTAETSSEERGLVELLRILSNTKLENLSICYHQGGLIAWHSVCSAPSAFLQPALKQMCFNHHLTSLHLMNLLFVPTSVIYAAFRLPNLRDLSIRSITVSYGISDISTTQSLAELTRLELRGIYYAAVFDGLLLPSLSSPLTWSPQDPPINFSCLKTLVVSLSKYADELNIMWNLIQCVAPSLESLVLEDYTSHGAEGIVLFRLGLLSSLRKFKFNTVFNHSIPAITKQQVLTHLLNSATPSMSIETLEIHFSVQIPDRFEDEYLISELPGVASEWRILDQVLSSEKFKFLREVKVSVDIFYQDAILDSPRFRTEQVGSLAQTFLPTVTESPSIDLQLYIQSVILPYPMGLYLHSF